LTQRIIGEYTGDEKGPLVISIGAMHGNEPAGVWALRTLFQMLQFEPNRNEGFRFKGRFVGILGNIQAYQSKKRFIEKDLNRQFDLAHIKAIKKAEKDLVFEDLELKNILQVIENEIVTYKPDTLIILDLHTTSATGGIFTIVGEDATGQSLAEQLNAPVVKGLVSGIGGTTLHYFKTENMGIPTVALSFEAGQHDDPLSTRRMLAWLVNCLRAIGCVNPKDVESSHDVILRGYSKNLPKVVQLIDYHRITPEDNFKMNPGYKNFQPVKKQEILAYDKKGPIEAQEDCLILMPLYQAQGSDGFFLVKDISSR
jgi:succinylglutamate desuccinylase